MSSDKLQPPLSGPSTYEESLVELPQRSVPQISIRFLLWLTTLFAVLFLLLRLASSGNRLAQVAALLVCLAIGTLLAFAVTYTVGMILNDRVRRSKQTPNVPQGSRNPSQSFDKPIGLMVLIAATCVAVPEVRAGINWQPAYRPASGSDFSLLVGTESMVGPGGYRTIYLRFDPRHKTFYEDHQLEFTLTSHCNRKAHFAAATSASFTLRQGEGQTEYTLLVPTFGATDGFEVELIDNGRRVTRDLATIYLGGGMGDHFMDQAVTVGIWNPVLLGKQALFPDVRSIVTVFGNSPNGAAPLPEDANEHRLPYDDSLRLASQVQPAYIQFRVFDDLSLHSNWLTWSGLDVMVVHQDFWSSSTVMDASRESLLRWVASGGSLWIYGESTGKDAFVGSLGMTATFKDLPSAHVSDRSQLTRQLELNQKNDTSPLEANWNGQQITRSRSSSGSTKVFTLRANVLKKLEAASNPIARVDTAKEVAARAHVAEYGLGRMVVIDGADPFPGSLQFWTAIRDWSQARDGPMGWIERYGLDYRAGSTNYWRWLIDSVGGPPVRSFLLLNSIFILTIGPIAYFVLRRLDKLYLLYFVAPAAAMLISTGLFAFAIVSDGLGTKLRTHQWVWVDAVNEVETQQDRSTYYSALGAGELRFSADAMVTIVAPIGSIDYSLYTGMGAYPGGRIKWFGDDQVWSGDFLPARAQTQYLITRPIAKTPSRLTFEISTDGSLAVTVTNHSDSTIGPLAYRTANGDYFRVEKVDSGQTQSMQSSKQQEVTALIDDRVLPPVGFVPDVQSSRSSYYNYSSPTGQTPILENRLASWRQVLPKGSFVGIAPCDPNRFGIENPEVSASLQVIMGRSE